MRSRGVGHKLHAVLNTLHAQMSQTPPAIGWFVYTPTDQKKQKPTLRWASVNEFWLEISAKPNEPPLLSIHLGFTDFRPPPPEENAPVNALVLKTSSVIGQFSMIISTNNRFDILDLNQALADGKRAWQATLGTGLPQLKFESSFKDKKSGFLGGKNVECSLTPEGFQTLKSATEKNFYTFDQIEYARPILFDSRKGECFEIALAHAHGQKDQSMVFQCHDHNEMKTFITLFLYHLVKQRG